MSKMVHDRAMVTTEVICDLSNGFQGHRRLLFKGECLKTVYFAFSYCSTADIHLFNLQCNVRCRR